MATFVQLKTLKIGADTDINIDNKKVKVSNLNSNSPKSKHCKKLFPYDSNSGLREINRMFADTCVVVVDDEDADGCLIVSELVKLGFL